MGKLASIKKIDYDFSFKIANLLTRDSQIRKIFQIATFTGTAIFWIPFLFLWYFFEWSPRDESQSMAFVFFLMLVPIYILKHTIKRSRPDFKDTRMGAVIMDEWSFPSGHASRSTYVMLLMPFYTPELVLFWVLWGSIMIISRLLLGVHFISDILGGILITSILVGIMFWIGWLPIIPFV